INDVLGNPFTIFERIKLRGVGSPKYIISQTDSIITNLLNLDNNTNQCNIELRPKGIIVSFRSLLETYALIIPFYKLKLFKGQSNVYSIYIDEYFIKILAKKKNEHEFIKKINKFKSTN
ncbi:MAG: hypothetical protein P8M27_02830, partial [Flavobacteriaceae bacterium]|nr:hypothetical protein [Flavobacteriaceae bacterium]